MTATNICPHCESSRINYVQTYGYWECDNCGNIWALDKDDPDYDARPLDLGKCCACNCTSESVQNLVMLDKKSPIPNTGWGCLTCGLPYDGAIAVVCDDCLQKLQSGQDILKYAVLGYPTEKGRCNIADLTEDFDHNYPHE